MKDIFVDGHDFYSDEGKQKTGSRRKMKGPVFAQLGFRCWIENKREMLNKAYL